MPQHGEAVALSDADEPSRVGVLDEGRAHFAHESSVRPQALDELGGRHGDGLDRRRKTELRASRGEQAQALALGAAMLHNPATCAVHNVTFGAFGMRILGAGIETSRFENSADSRSSSFGICAFSPSGASACEVGSKKFAVL